MVVRVLTSRWDRVTGADWPPEESARLGKDLLRRYAEPHRRYHDQRHLLAVLRALDELGGDVGVPVTTTLAAWFHDAVYDPVRDDNEEASARLAEMRLPALGAPADDVVEVARLVRLTAGHVASPGDPGEVLLDADLAVLGGSRGEYDAYAAAVRKEYRHVPDAAFRAGRLAVLLSLRDRPFLYATATGRRRWESAARSNLNREITALSRPA